MRFTLKILLLVTFLISTQSVSAEWRKQSANTLAWLRTIHFIDANNGWIGGSKGTLLKTVDGGESWSKTPGLVSDSIRQIVFTDKKNGWLLCERDIYSLGRAEASYLMKTADGGATWNRIDLRNPLRQRITRIFFAKNGFGLAIGETGALFGLKDDDTSWKRLTLPSSYLMSDGVFIDEFRGTIVGGGGTILFTEDAGISWNRAFVSGKPASRFNAIFFNDKRVGWTVGSGGKIFQTVNGGRIWRAQRSNSAERLNDVFFLNSAEGWAVGDNGEMLHTTTAGNIWRRINSTSPHRLESIYFNGRRGWVVGFGGTILRYDARKASEITKRAFRKRS